MFRIGCMHGDGLENDKTYSPPIYVRLESDRGHMHSIHGLIHKCEHDLAKDGDAWRVGHTTWPVRTMHYCATKAGDDEDMS
jgi:hypothetical protein